MPDSLAPKLRTGQQHAAQQADTLLQLLRGERWPAALVCSTRTAQRRLHQAPRQRLKRTGAMSAAAPASPPKAASAGGFSTPSKRSSSEVDGPAVAVKKRHRSTAEAVPPRDVTCGVCLEPVAAACKPSSCGHLLCQTCAYGLWCCPQCRAVRFSSPLCLC